jgi:citrate lyase subunit beta/citryl-CoA lyase
MNSARVRSALFTPGTEAVRLRKAAVSGADVCIFDLEDSVPPARIAEARQIVGEAVRELAGQARIWVRVHAASTDLMPDDLRNLPLDQFEAVVLPKVSDSSDIEACRRSMKHAQTPIELPVVPIVESAAGVTHCQDIADATGTLCLALGRFDLAADLGIDPASGSPALIAARAAVVLASAAERLPKPLDSPWLAINDLDGLRKAAQRARADGFGGMLLIHPSHVPVVNEVFSPTPNEIAWARGILDSADEATAQGRAAYAKDGAMVDEAIIRRARSVLEQVSS